MANARQYSTLFDLVGKNCGDESATGDTDAQNGINEAIRQLQTELDIPSLLTGFDGSVTLTLTATTGPATLSLAAAVKTVVSVWHTINGAITMLHEVTSHEEWLRRTDTNSTGDPTLYRQIPQQGSTASQLQIWPGPNSTFITNATNLKYAYWSQLATLSANGDIPGIPFEHDVVLVSGGSFYMALKQPDLTLADFWSKIYERDKANLRAWITSRRYSETQQILPADVLLPGGGLGVEPKDYGRITVP